MQYKKINWIILACAIWLFVGCSSPKETETKKEEKTVTIQKTGEIPVLTKREQQILDFSQASLDSLAKSSSTAKNLLAFYKSSAVKAKFIAEGTIQVAEKPKTNEFFFVYAIPTDQQLQASGVYIAAKFDPEIRALGIYGYSFSHLVAGLFACHELSHASDCLSGIESPDAELLSPEWIAGELHGHSTVFAVLNEATKGKWKKIAEASRSQREKIAIAQGSWPSSFTFGAMPEDSVRIFSIFGTLLRNDRFFLLTQLCVDANLLNIRKYAQDDQFMFSRGARLFLKDFYSKYQAQ